jgi:CRISPR-associated endoribonuclease Cas6
MRLHFVLSPNTQPVPFGYPHFLTGAFHRWLGNNELHDGLSLYSLGWLQGGKADRGGLQFPRGAQWFMSAPDSQSGAHLLETIARSALTSPDVCCGMEVREVAAEATPEFGLRRVFRANSPILVKDKDDSEGKIPHLLWNDPRADELLTKTLRHKLDAAGLGDHSPGATMRFVRDYRGAKSKLISIKGIQNRANFCPVIVEGAPEVVQFAWNVGAGHLTGSCFGSLI